MDIFPETYNDPIFLLIVDFVKASLGWGGWGGVGSKRAATVVGWFGGVGSKRGATVVG